MRLISVLLFFSLLTAEVPAQQRSIPQPDGAADPLNRILWELWLRDTSNRQPNQDREISERYAAAYREQQFRNKVNRFVELWNKLLSEYSQRHVINVKKARDLSRAFRDLESTGWPK